MTSGPANAFKVFLAEDSEFIRERLHALLRAACLDVVGEAATPQACIEGILALKPDAVVLDVELDGGSGLQVLQAVRSAAPRVAFVVFSTTVGPAYRESYLAAGAIQFLDKSKDAAHLAQALTDACGQAGRQA
jgi:DNA-binding NarL/FixJ family response regulator